MFSGKSRGLEAREIPSDSVGHKYSLQCTRLVVKFSTMSCLACAGLSVYRIVINGTHAQGNHLTALEGEPYVFAPGAIVDIDASL